MLKYIMNVFVSYFSLVIFILNSAAYSQIMIPEDIDRQEEKYITISGEVKSPGKHVIKKGEKLSSVLEHAGGYTDNAYLRAAVFTRENIRELQQKNLDGMIARLERELFTEGSTQLSSARKFIESLKSLKAAGRISIKLTHLRLLKGSQFDIELEEGDSLYIPLESGVVNVDGAVMSRGSYKYSGKLGYKDYIKMAGGYSEYADNDNIYVLKVDGAVMRPSQEFISWNDSKSRWELTAFSEDKNGIEPGDTIVVAEKLNRIAWLREIKDITQIIYQIAAMTGAAVGAL